VSCDSERYLFAFWWAVAMVFVYPVGKYNSLFFINVGWTYTMYVCIFYMTNVYTGIPLLYFCILRVSRVRNKNSGIPIEVINMLCEDFTDQYWYESWRTECDVLLFVIDECWQRHLRLTLVLCIKVLDSGWCCLSSCCDGECVLLSSLLNWLITALSVRVTTVCVSHVFLGCIGTF
jgi:hypothetical protein